MRMGKNPNYLGSWDLDDAPSREITLTIEKIVDEKVVADGRKIPYEKLVNSPLTDGRILDGKQALAAGLVDRNGYFDDAVQEAEILGKVAPGSAKVVLMKPQTDFMDMLLEFSTSVGKPSVKVDLPGSSSFQLTPGKAYYLPVNQ